MNRSTRTFIVVAVAVAVASAATYLVFVALMNRPTEKVEVASAFALVAARPLPMGTKIAAADVKLVPWPADSLIPGGFTAVDQALDRGVISPLSENEPLTGNNVASKEVGAGLGAMIPAGMRAVSVRVNEVIGVAGFVVSGARVDVMVILREGADSLARVVVNNVTVLAADAKADQSAARQGENTRSSVVTLLVTPADAERISLAASEGQIMLTLRNPTDITDADSRGIRRANLRSDAASPVEPTARPAAQRRPTVAPPPPPTAPKVYVVETIRAAKRTEDPIK